MQFILTESITQQYGMEAGSAEEAIHQREKGKGIAMPNRSVNRSAVPRPGAPVVLPATPAPAVQATGPSALEKMAARKPAAKPKKKS